MKTKKHKKVCHKRKLKFQDYKYCVEVTHLKNKINHVTATGFEPIIA